MDLKGTTSIIITDFWWNDSSIYQVIGRAIRLGSHSHLPQSQRNVKVHKLFVVKPEEKAVIDQFDLEHSIVKPKDVVDRSGVTLSIDLYMYLSAKRKQQIIDKFLNQLHVASIENNQDCY